MFSSREVHRAVGSVPRTRSGAIGILPGLFVAALFVAQPGSAAVYTYENTVGGTIPDALTDAACESSGLQVHFQVPEELTLTSVALGLTISHPDRNDVRAVLSAPDGATRLAVVTQELVPDIPSSANYDILISGNTDPTANLLDDGDADPVGVPFFNRLVTLAAMDTTWDLLSPSTVEGEWTLVVCDRVGIEGETKTVDRARLILTDATTGGQVCNAAPTYNWCAPGCADGSPFPPAGVTNGGATLTLAGPPIDADLDDNGGSGVYTPSFARQVEQLGGDTGIYTMGMNVNAGGGAVDTEAAAMITTWNFSVPVNDLRWTALDVDFANGTIFGFCINCFEDYERTVGFTGTGGAGTAVPYVLTNGTSNQIAGDIVEGDSEVPVGSPAVTTANSTRRFLRGVSSVTFGYSAGEDGANPSLTQYVGIGDLSYCVFDFGDAPDTTSVPPRNYGTLLANDGARHVMGARNIYLGGSPPDGENDGQPGVAATGDQAGVIADETVPTFPACSGSTYTVSVSASVLPSAAGSATLVGFIDWNRDGDFDDGTNEESAAVVIPQVFGDPLNYDVTWSGVPANCGDTTQTYARFRIATSAAEAGAPTGLANDGEVEDYLIPAGTLPVTLASIESELNGGSLTVRWSTASESGNAGFRLWGYNGRGERRLLSTVKSQGSDSFGVQRYEAFVGGKGIQRIEIEDISVHRGESRFHGPYAIGSSYGVEPEDATIDWAAIKSESGVVGEVELMAAAEGGESSVRSMIAMSGEKQGRLLVREEGIHRVTYEQLRSAGIDLAGIKHARIAVTNNGAAVPRHISAMGSTFGPGASIEFVARPALTLASPVDAYIVQVNPAKVKVAGSMAAASGVTRTIDATDLHEGELAYSFSAPNGDPWYEQGLLAWGGPASLSRSFDLPDLATGTVTLDLRLWGYGDWSGVTPDHHAIVKLNGSQIADQQFDGVTTMNLSVDITSLVSESGNTLEVLVPGDTGYMFDYTVYDGFTVRYRRSSEAIDGKFVAKGVPGGNVAIGGFDPGALVSVWRLAGVNGQRGLQTPVGGQVFSTGNGDLFAAAGVSIRTPAIVAGIPAAKASSGADYVIVTHPVFADALGDLVALQEAKGLSTEVVTVDRIYSAYSDHAASPAAIRSFFSASLAKGMQYALIVGADSSDPYDHLNLGSVSYVPTDYLPLNTYVQFSPTDESLVDANSDGLGDAPIGRFPARTVAELEAMVAKLYAWESQVATGRTALLAAGISDTEAALIDAINDSYAATLADWSPATAAVDELGSAAARVAVLEALNGGTKLVSYVGHSSMGQWDWTPLLQWQDAASLTNNGAPNLVTAWGCWNSYYVEPTIESLSARLLRQPNAGAAGAIGATTLTSEASHQALGNLFFQQVNGGATRVGDAFHAAKQALAAEGGAQDAIMGMTLLGDPAMSLPPAE